MITRRVKPVARLVREGSTSQAVSQANWMQRFRGLHISDSVADPCAVETVRELRDVWLTASDDREELLSRHLFAGVADVWGWRFCCSGHLARAGAVPIAVL